MSTWTANPAAKTGQTGTWHSWLTSSAFTLRRDFPEKASFVALNALDLIITIAAVRLGCSEMNPLVNVLLASPLLFAFIKLPVNFFIAWLVPGKLLLPATALMAFVLIWNIKELVVFLSGT